jgi:PAS domain-containing protein
MGSRAIGSDVALRLRAVSHLNGRVEPHDPRVSGSTALGVLHDLASSPTTAADALALLHELQVHQVELDLQAEELQSTRAELEAALARQTELYDFAPVGCFTLDALGVLCELNFAGAHLLGGDRESLLGRRLDGFLAPPARPSLQSMLARVAAGGSASPCTLTLHVPDGVTRRLQFAVAADPAGPGYFVALTDLGNQGA